MDMKNLAIILFGAILTNNYVLSRFLGICPFLGVSKKLDQATGMGIAVTAVMLLASAVTWPIQYYVLNALELGYLQNIVFILVIAALVQMTELLLKKFSPALHKGLGVYLPLITTNCAVLGVTINNINDESGLPAGYGAVLRSALPHQRGQHPHPFPRSAGDPHCRRFHLPGIYGLRRYR